MKWRQKGCDSFKVVSYEGCWRGDECDTPHYFVDCENHGTLARVGDEDTARFIMVSHARTAGWPTNPTPPTKTSMARIAAARRSENQLFVPQGYRP